MRDHMTQRDRDTLAAILSIDWTQPDPIHEWTKANPRQSETIKVAAKPSAKTKRETMFERGAA